MKTTAVRPTVASPLLKRSTECFESLMLRHCSAERTSVSHSEFLSVRPEPVEGLRDFLQQPTSPDYSCCCAPGKPAAPQAGAIPPCLLPNRTKPPAISFTTSGRQVGVSCIIKCPVTGVNPNIFCSLTRVRFGAPAFVYRPGFPSCERDREASPGGCGQRDVEVTFRPGPWEPPPLERIGWRPTR